jgi:hypothetical protein
MLGAASPSDTLTSHLDCPYEPIHLQHAESADGLSLSTKVSPEASLAFARAAREAKTTESDYLRRLVLSDATVARHLGDPEQRRRFNR